MISPQDRRQHVPGAPRRALPAGLSGLLQPVVVVLLAIALFSAIAGKPLDGLLMLCAAVGLAWDARPRPGSPAPPAAAPDGVPPGAGGVPVRPGGALARAGSSPSPVRGRRLRLGMAAALTAAGIVYAVAVGSFSPFSWPATGAVAGLGAGVVVTCWRAPARHAPGRLPRRGTGLWAAALVAGAGWELWSLSQQPSLDTTSWAHPTISALTDPLPASHPGRSLILAAWLLLGWYLVRR